MKALSPSPSVDHSVVGSPSTAAFLKAPSIWFSVIDRPVSFSWSAFSILVPASFACFAILEKVFSRMPKIQYDISFSRKLTSSTGS